MSQADHILRNGNRQPSENGARSVTTTIGEPDVKKEAFLKRLNELRLWLGRKYVAFPRPCADRSVVEDLTRLVNLISEAECAGRSNASRVWPRMIDAESDGPGSENWIG